MMSPNRQGQFFLDFKSYKLEDILPRSPKGSIIISLRMHPIEHIKNLVDELKKNSVQTFIVYKV